MFRKKNKIKNHDPEPKDTEKKNNGVNLRWVISYDDNHWVRYRDNYWDGPHRNIGADYPEDDHDTVLDRMEKYCDDHLGETIIRNDLTELLFVVASQHRPEIETDINFTVRNFSEIRTTISSILEYLKKSKGTKNDLDKINIRIRHQDRIN